MRTEAVEMTRNNLPMVAPSFNSIPADRYRDASGARILQFRKPTTERRLPREEGSVEFPINYTDIDTTLEKTLHMGSTVWISGADTTPQKLITSAIRKRADAIELEEGTKDTPVITEYTGVHTSEQPIIKKGEKGPIRRIMLFTGGDYRKLNQDEGTPCVESMRDADGHLARLEDQPKAIWSGKLKIDNVIVSVSKPDKNGFFSTGPNAELTAEIINYARYCRAHGIKPPTIIAIENPNIPYVNDPESDVLLHHLEADYVVQDDEPLPEHGHGKENAEAVAVAGVINQAVEEILDLPENKGRDVNEQAGIGDGPNKQVEGTAKICEEQGRGFAMITEVVSTSAPPLLDQGKIKKVATSFAMGISRYLKEHENDPEKKISVRRTSKINSVEAISEANAKSLEDFNKEREKRGLPPTDKLPIFFAVNWTMVLNAVNGDASAAEKPIYDENGEVVGHTVQAGHGGQRIMMQAGHELGASIIGLQAERIVNGKSVSAIVLETHGAETTTPGDIIDIYATKYGYHKRIPLTGDPEQDRIIRQKNIRGIIGIAAPQHREALIREAQEKGLLPAEQKSPMNIFPNPIEVYVKGVEAGMLLYNRMLSSYLPPYGKPHNIH